MVIGAEYTVCLTCVLAGCDPKFLKNLKFAKKHNLNKHQREKKALKDA